MENESTDDCRCHATRAPDPGCEKHRGHVWTEVYRAGDIDSGGFSIGADVLRLMQDGKRLFYDAEQCLLYWFGPHHELPRHYPRRVLITVPQHVHVHVESLCVTIPTLAATTTP